MNIPWCFTPFQHLELEVAENLASKPMDSHEFLVQQKRPCFMHSAAQMALQAEEQRCNNYLNRTGFTSRGWRLLNIYCAWLVTFIHKVHGLLSCCWWSCLVNFKNHVSNRMKCSRILVREGHIELSWIEGLCVSFSWWPQGIEGQLNGTEKWSKQQKSDALIMTHLSWQEKNIRAQE